MEYIINKKFVLSVTFGDYKHTRGGVAKVVSAHQQMFNEKGVSYICIYPFNLRNSKPKKNNRYWGVIIDGVLEQVLSTKNLLTLLGQIYFKGSTCESIHIHHLMRVDIVELKKILNAISSNILFYIHDYYTICNSATLLNYKGVLCEEGFLTNEKCADCKFYCPSLDFKVKFYDFVNCFKSRIKFLCPSNACKRWFLKQYSEYAKDTFVVFHQLTKGIYHIPISDSDKIKVAYVGVPVPAKGWTQFTNLYKKFKNDARYEFVYFSSVKDNNTDIRNVPVNFQTSLSAMLDAIRLEKVDYVVLWSTWPETYSYTYYESYNSGCCILTNKDSGNIAEQVINMEAGLVMTEKELMGFFDDFEQVSNFRRKYVKQKISVGKILYENDEIVNISEESCGTWTGTLEKTIHIDLIGILLKAAYIAKIRCKKRN